jgi:hypothetical protein
MKMLKAAGGLALLVLIAFPGAALAHTGSATVSCTAADFQFTRFMPGSNTVHYKVTVDNVAVAGSDFVLNQSGGSAGSLHVPLDVHGTHTVNAYAWWGPVGTVANHTGGSYSVPMATEQVTCAPAPPPPPAPAPQPAPAPAPAAPPAAAAPAATPQGAVQGVKATSPARIASLAGMQKSCTSRTVRITVAGRSMRAVSFSVNGRHVRTVKVRSGKRSVIATVPMVNRRSAQVVTARVTFRNGARARTLSARTNRCAQAEVQPQFTG